MTRGSQAAPTLAITNSSMLTSSASVMRPVWIWKMRLFVFWSGSGNSILRSMRPGRMRAGSSESIRLVAMMTCGSTWERRIQVCGGQGIAG
jgi:hypothetical protein